jgi:flavin reductase (DIM6/NTAB) family NADH-FMN oxidoreductase RutF
MKIELNETRPGNFRIEWEGQYDVFSYLEFVCSVPSPIFLVTTRKENGLPNAAMQAWSSFGGDSGGYFAVMQGVMQRTHTYANILREKEFCINFLAPQYYGNLRETVLKNETETDEITGCGMTAEPAAAIGAPRIREAFLTMECTLESHTDLSGAGVNSMIIGRVRHVSVDSNHGSIANICSPNAFMYNVHSPKDAQTGLGETSAVAVLTSLRDA